MFKKIYFKIAIKYCPKNQAIDRNEHLKFYLRLFKMMKLVTFR